MLGVDSAPQHETLAGHGWSRPWEGSPFGAAHVEDDRPWRLIPGTR